MMDGGKPKEQLRRELEDMQQRIAEFGKSKAEHKKKVEKEMIFWPVLTGTISMG